MMLLLIKIIVGTFTVYCGVRLLFYAISKSWHEAKKHVEKEEKNEFSEDG